MDVHPPHESIHTWRDALTHIAIMTVGLFIALMLEGLVEYGHHRSLVREARENIRQELEQNHKSVQENIAAVGKESALANKGLDAMRYMRLHPQAHGQSISFQWSISDLHDAAWRTARDSGALGYMPLKEVQADADVYGLQTTVSNEAATLLTRQAELLAPVLAHDAEFEKIPQAEYDEMLRTTAVNILDLMTLKQLMLGLDQSYADALRSGRTQSR